MHIITRWAFSAMKFLRYIVKIVDESVNSIEVIFHKVILNVVVFFQMGWEHKVETMRIQFESWKKDLEFMEHRDYPTNAITLNDLVLRYQWEQLRWIQKEICYYFKLSMIRKKNNLEPLKWWPK